MSEENQFFKFLERIMFKEKGEVTLIGCAMQFDLAEDDGHNVPDHAYKIRQLIVDEIKKYKGVEATNNFNPQIIPLPVAPFNVVLLDTRNQSIGYSKGFKIDNGSIWSAIDEADLGKNIKAFFDFFKTIAEVTAIKKVKRIGIVSTYKTKLSNMDDCYMVSTHKDIVLKGATLDLNKEISGRKYDCRLVQAREDNTNINFDVSLKGSFELHELESIVKEMSEKIQRDQALNLFGIVKDLRA